MMTAVTVRALSEADLPAVSAIRVTGWQTAYAGILPRSYLDAMTVEADLPRRRARFAKGAPPRTAEFVAVDRDGRVAGWTCLGPYRSDVYSEGGAGGEVPATAGELYALYVRPALIGSGVGLALVGAAHSRAREEGFGELLLWVLADNARARRFYERAGYASDGAVQAEAYDGVPVPEVRYRRSLGG
ncbi:GNAT family N-acetyltransferase [Streptomyces sp. NRRL F-5123]|uniref:GNAT family N-acetyltransferase n=1 Tax=Streptomyces sp. NRRL F-5123 TaxID=1463856 RepID=UPI0006947A55|nr:GNAT family N-acetyltransferase [Streptomyces sp. NRRL F-5123]